MQDSFFIQLKNMAEEAAIKGYMSSAISLYSLCGAIASHKEEEFSKMCSDFSRKELDEMKAKLN